MIDSHFHLDETIVSLPGLIASMDEAGIERTALIPTVCPRLEHLPGPVMAAMPLVRRFLHGPPGLLHRAMIKVYGIAVKHDDTVLLFGKRYPLIVQPDNDKVMAAVTKHPDRFSGWTWVNPHGPVDAVKEAERCIDAPGMIGLKAHPFWHDYPVKDLLGAAAVAARRNKPMLIHLGPESHGDFRVLHRELPELKAVYAHLGIPYSHDLVRFARDHKNVYVDTASLEYTDARCIRAVIDTAGPHKVLFGSDGPFFHDRDLHFDYSPYLKLLDDLALSAADRERVTEKNFLEVTQGA